ncbi:MAG: ARMT1-like domain-containing protein [Candidatus Omnitrophota bacterium]
MLAQKQCLKCLKNLVKMTIELSFLQSKISAKINQDIKISLLKELNLQFCLKKVPAEVFTKINRKIKKLSGIEDAFAQRKQQELNSAKIISTKLLENNSLSLEELVLLSAKGNSLDFFKTIQESEKDMKKKISFALNHFDLFAKKLKKSKNIVFFADNAGEWFFDQPLISFLTLTNKVYYVVKSSSIQNDLTIVDLKNLTDNLNFANNIIPSGNDAVGIELSTITPALSSKIKQADIIIAKGMGYYETFTELPEYKTKVFHLLMAKCAPVAKSLGVSLNSYVFTQS